MTQILAQKGSPLRELGFRPKNWSEAPHARQPASCLRQSACSHLAFGSMAREQSVIADSFPSARPRNFCYHIALAGIRRFAEAGVQNLEDRFAHMRPASASLLLLAAGIFPSGIAALVPGHANGQAPAKPSENRKRAATNVVTAIDVQGLHNVFRLTDNLLSGSSPEGDAGFESLRKLGIKTIISVDGARPDLARARKYGLRYVHLPIGYDGIRREQALRIVKAARELPGPVYIHCHHGKHRGPAAAAVVHLCTDDTCPVETAVAEMRRAGTDARYQGLYAAPREFRKPTAQELQRVSSDFPEVANIPGFAQVMVNVDDCWDHMTEIRKAGWKAPKKSPDLEPAHEALQLLEHFREAARLPEVKQRPQDFQKWLAEAARRAEELENVLRSGQEKRPLYQKAAEQAFQNVNRSCVACHVKYRDVPQKP
jgi:protein tyrosine phosphatase (PTP) superfamily phosphohydrolase (DUF442 family)